MATAIKLPDFGKQPRKRLPAFRLGANLVEWQTPTGRVRDIVWMDEADMQSVLDAYNRQGNALPIYKDHNEADGAFGAMVLEPSTQGGIDQVWALNPSGAQLAAEGRYLYDSPEILTKRGQDGRKHLAEIRSGSLVNKPARTGSEPLLLSAMKSAIRSETQKLMSDALEKLGALEKAVQGMVSSDDALLKKVGDIFAPVLGPAIAAMQGHMQAQQPQVATMSADAKDAAALGVEVLKMTGAGSSDEALGLLEAKEAQVSKMSALLVKLGVETGRLEAGDADKFAKLSPARLMARLEVAEPLNLSAKREQPKEAAQEAKKEPEHDDSAYEAAISANRIKG